MTVRITYEHELEELNKDLREMAFMVEKAIEQTFVAFEDQNYTLAEDVIKGDRTVNDMERAIESRCLSLILRQQPVACDLRQISTALKVVTDQRPETFNFIRSNYGEICRKRTSEYPAGSQGNVEAGLPATG